MNIGIDIDGVLTNYGRQIIDYGTKMCIEEGWPINIDIDEYLEENAFNWNKEQAYKFTDRYFIKYLIQCPVREFAPEIIEKLRKEGDKIFLITARNDEEMPKEYYGKMKPLTKKWLTNQNIKYDKIFFEKEKLKLCIDNNIDVMIEDSPQNIQNISKQIKVIKFDCRYNKEVYNENITIAYSWYHIYDIINKMKKSLS